MAPGVYIREHRDPWHGLATGLIRMQLGVSGTNGARLTIDGHEVSPRAGELWYTDVSLPHSVRNEGNAPRLNLLMDVELSERSFPCLAQIVAGEQHVIEQVPELSVDQLRRFRRRVVIPEGLQEVMGGWGSARIDERDRVLFLIFDTGQHVRLKPRSPDRLGIVGTAPGLVMIFDHENGDVSVHLRGSDYDTGWKAQGVVPITS
jgi:hypothetical protein